jgi:Putative Ig domain
MWLFRSLLVTLAGLVCAAAPLHFRTEELPWAAIGAGYSANIEVQVDGRCPHADASLSVVDGALPRGLQLEGNVFTGVPREPGTFHFRVRAANICSAAEREFSLLVTGKPILRVTPAEVTFEYHTGGPLPPPKSILVSSTWPELPYSVSGDTSWLHARQNQGVTPYPGSAFAADAVTVEACPKDLWPGTYETTLIFSAAQAATAPSIRVRLTVVAGN